MYVRFGYFFLEQSDYSEVGGNEGVWVRAAYAAQKSGKLRVFAAVREHVNGYIQFFSEPVKIIRRAVYFLNREVAGGGADSERFTRKLYCIRGETYCGGELFVISRRGKQFGRCDIFIVHLFFLSVFVRNAVSAFMIFYHKCAARSMPVR